MLRGLWFPPLPREVRTAALSSLSSARQSWLQNFSAPYFAENTWPHHSQTAFRFTPASSLVLGPLFLDASLSRLVAL